MSAAPPENSVSADAEGNHFRIKVIADREAGKSYHLSHDWMVFAPSADEASAKLKAKLCGHSDVAPVYFGTPLPLQGDCFSLGGSGAFDRDLVSVMIRQQERNQDTVSGAKEVPSTARPQTIPVSTVPSEEAREETAKQLYAKFPHLIEKDRGYEGATWQQLSPRGRKPFYEIADFFGARWVRG
jgi:hypothetical protein